ncbi:MAG: hypothetical protein A3F46_09185 [Legionellales bacterium RIFCSPHIGHO2_12_FULL_42_9]|nr:MAG: hypothetical protein A3F46_09185 [Legionellales bacterium RIFCSPHIGHO2_12_FULL_42_9]
MDYEAVLNFIFKNTQHSVESIAEILDLDPSELLDSLNLNEKRINKLKLLSDFLRQYDLISNMDPV